MTAPNESPFAVGALTEKLAQAWLEGMSPFEREFVMAILRLSPDYRCELRDMMLPPGLPSAIVAVEAAVGQLETAFIKEIDWD